MMEEYFKGLMNEESERERELEEVGRGTGSWKD